MTDGKMTIGYIRVSSLDQNTARQLEGIETDRNYTDKVSGKSLDRPELKRAMETLRSGDKLVVHSMDRLARNMDDLRKVVKELTERGVEVRFVKESLTFTSKADAMSNMMLSILGAVAEFERELIKERQREGIAIAKTAGVYKGRKASLTAAQVTEIRTRVDRKSTRLNSSH